MCFDEHYKKKPVNASIPDFRMASCSVKPHNAKPIANPTLRVAPAGAPCVGAAGPAAGGARGRGVLAACVGGGQPGAVRLQRQGGGRGVGRGAERHQPARAGRDSSLSGRDPIGPDHCPLLGSSILGGSWVQGCPHACLVYAHTLHSGAQRGEGDDALAPQTRKSGNMSPDPPPLGFNGS